VSLKSLLSHHPSGCQPVQPVSPTGPTPVAALSGGPTGPMAGDAAWLGLGIRSIRVIRFGIFGFVKFRVLKNENRNFQNKLGTEPE
jgi:hypothetical protein